MTPEPKSDLLEALHAAAGCNGGSAIWKDEDAVLKAAEVIRVLAKALEQVSNTTHRTTGYSDLSARRAAFKVASEALLSLNKEGRS